MFSQIVIDALHDKREQSAKFDASNLDLVIKNLVFSHQVITASEGLLEEAIIASDGELRDYFFDHLEEERNHQKWLADDLATAGIDVSTQPLIRTAVEMAGSQYYLIKHVSPLCLLGYMACLEGFPVSMENVEILESMHGKDLFRTLRYHAEHDLEHRKELFSMIDKYQDDRILASAVQSQIYMNEFTSELNQG